MDTHSSSVDDQFIKEELHGEPSIVITKSLPYQSLLVELQTLNLNHEASFQGDAMFGNPRKWFQLTPFMRQEIWNLQQELMLQQMIFMLLLNHGVRSESLLDVQTTAENQAELIQKVAAALNVNLDFAARSVYFDQWESGLSVFRETMDTKIKPRIKEFFVGIIDRLLQGKSTKEYGIFVFVNVIFLKLKDIQNLKPNLIDHVNKEMQFLEEMLNYALIISGKMTNVDETLQNFLDYFEPWVKIAAAVVIMYWVDEKDEKAFALVSSSLKKFNISFVEYVEAYIVVIKALRPSNVSEILMMRGTVGQFTNMILEKLINHDDEDELFATFKAGLTFWIALLLDPPKGDAEHEKSICSQINVLLDEAKSLICSLCQEKMDEDLAERRNTLVNEFLEKINKAKAEIRLLPVHQIPGLSWNNIPKTNTTVLFDFLLGNLQKKLEAEDELFPFEEHMIETVHEDLSILRPFLIDIFELQDEHKEFKDIWVQASNAAYLVDYLTDFCLSHMDVPVWFILMHLSDAIERLRSVKTKVSKIRKKIQIYKNRISRAKLNSEIVLPGRHEAKVTTKNDDIEVGFTEDEQRIIDRLIAGECGRDIVAIVGMPGQGKTYLAQRVFRDSRIKNHFTEFAWCCISQAYDIKKVLRDILENVGKTVSPELFSSLTQEDLADQLKKCLKGQKYMVVLDDMWDAERWCDLNLAFPDDNNGSRILVTSRNLNVALDVKANNSSIVELHPLSHDDSWKLLRMEVFDGDCCPSELSDIGNMIVENCKGLPLAIVVVARLLKEDKDLDSWKRISESLKEHITSEGCMNVLELSYKYLPDYLKPCFLYLGAFREDQLIDAKQLIQFWIAEGFVQNDGTNPMEIVGKDYLMDLASRSLILIEQRSSRNGIRKFRVHDLLHQLCLIKAEEERFMLVPRSSDLKDHHHRISVHEKWGSFLDSKPTVPGLRSLIVTVSRFDYPSYAPGFLKDFKLIRVLELSHAIVTQTDFHDITQLIHLRLLAVACRFSIPPSIVCLLRLEVLRIRYVGASVNLPSAVIKMASLRHIYASKCTIEYIEEFDMLVPDLSSPLTNLETFTSVLFINEVSFKRIAEMLPNLLKLGVTLTFCVLLSSYFKKLESLKLSILELPHETEPISPSILDFPITLRKLNLTAKRPLSVAMISSIGKLRNLEVLKLDAHFEDGRWEVEGDEFLQLKYLDFRLSSIQEWNVFDESFPCLEQLIVRKCVELGELPMRFGSVSTLRRIEVGNCSESLSDSFLQIVNDQLEAGNEGLKYSFSSLASS